MSKRKLPDYRLKQKILYIDKTSTASLISYGDLYRVSGALTDAVDFYDKASHHAGLQKIKELAMETGDTFLFQRAAKALNIELHNTDWEEIGRKATGHKKYLFARHALEKANNAELLNALMTTMKAEELEKSA